MYGILPHADDDEHGRPIANPSNVSPQRTLSPWDISSGPTGMPSHDDDWLLRIDGGQAGTVGSETDASNQSDLLLEDGVRSRDLKSQKFSKYSPFTNHGREALRRKLLSSGPANSTKDEEGDEIDRSERRAGWRTGTWACCFAVALCIVIELVLLIWAAARSIGGPNSGLLFEGNCDKTKSMTIWLLLPLNIAGTILIATSNYVMQVTTAASRSDIDAAHRSARAVAICGMGLRDSGGGHIRRIIWWLLVLSSLPIHLLLNSAIYGSVQASDTGVLVVSDDFENDPGWVDCKTESTGSNTPSSRFACSLVQEFKAGNTTEMSRAQCMRQYASGFQTNASSVIVVTAADSHPWYSPAHAAKVPASYGAACRENSAKGTYEAVPDSERYFNIAYSAASGLASVSLSFDTNCANTTAKNSSTGRKILTLTPGDSVENYSSNPSSFFFTPNDTLSKMTSVRSVFNAVNYRYWATAETSGDYLKADYQSLSKGWDARSWLCPRNDLQQELQCDPLTLAAESGWKITPAEIQVSKCHVLRKEERCTFRYSWRILLITICCDLVKFAAMVSALKFVSDPLTTLGDVIASFLQDPDPYTKNCCLLDDQNARELTLHRATERPVVRLRLKEANSGIDAGRCGPTLQWIDMRNEGGMTTQYMEDAGHWWGNSGLWWRTVAPIATPESWAIADKRRIWALSDPRWFSFAVLHSILMGLSITYFSLSLKELKSKRLVDMWATGLSGPDPNALWEGGLLNGASNVSQAAFVVNLPQLLFSMLYFLFNGMFTMMHTAKEWADFTKHRKGLRVSSPRGQQRSTYWLQLPWAYSLPLVIASGSIHWLLGRSIYLVKVEVYGYLGELQPDEDFFAAGYSPVTTLILILLLTLMGIALLVVASWKLEPGIPLVRFNSLAIAAACHADPSEKDVALKPLMWGVVQDENGNETQHCSFSSREVSPLREGGLYS